MPETTRAPCTLGGRHLRYALAVAYPAVERTGDGFHQTCHTRFLGALNASRGHGAVAGAVVVGGAGATRYLAIAIDKIWLCASSGIRY